MKKKVLAAIADGIEEIEAVTCIDVLRRAGADVTVASAGPLQVTASRAVGLVADVKCADAGCESYDLIVLPGGMPGAERLRDCEILVTLLKRHAAEGRIYAAICASPVVVLQHHGLLKGRKATCHPAFVEQLEDNGAVESRVVVDGNCVTSRGPGTAMEFALKLAELLFGARKALEVAGEMVV